MPAGRPGPRPRREFSYELQDVSHTGAIFRMNCRTSRTPARILRDDEQGAKGLTEKAEAGKRRRIKWKPEKRQKMMSQ
ncbi:hypothetical protein ABEV00_01650 [Paenibacillus thiaminolyticus]|uniref:hypothetical protein n=1 Tax=Paenibacillus thiaminolyticus TaxID=49283 RepID=UPI003D2C0B44